MNNNKLCITIYEPNSVLKSGIMVWRDMIHELIKSRELIWRFIVRDISARFKQSFLGVFWAFLSPLIMVLIFVWIKTKNFLPIPESNIPYASFVFIGQVVWLLFSHGINTSASSLVSAGAMLTKINFPKEALVISSVGQTIFEFLLRLPLLGIVFWWTNFFPNPAIIIFPLVLIPLLFLVIGIGFFVAMFNTFFRDINNIISIILNLGMFATPVIYPPPTQWPLCFWVNIANPISGYIIAVRELATIGHILHIEIYIFDTLFSLLVFLIGWRLIHILEPKIAERI